jgi:hypothetical protein
MPTQTLAGVYPIAVCAYVSIRQHTSAYVSIRQTLAGVYSIRQHTSAYVSIRQTLAGVYSIAVCRHQYSSMRTHIYQYDDACSSMRTHVAVCEHTYRLRHEHFILLPRHFKFAFHSAESLLRACEGVSAYVSIRQHTSAYVSIRSAYVSIRTSAYVSMRQICLPQCEEPPERAPRRASIRQHTSAYASIRQHASAYASIRQHTSAYVSIRQHTSAYVRMRQICLRQGEGPPETA